MTDSFCNLDLRKIDNYNQSENLKEEGIIVKALIVLDCQNGMFSRGDFTVLKTNILKLQQMFKSQEYLVINTKHIDPAPQSIIYAGNESGELDEQLTKLADIVLEKETPNIFRGTELQTILSNHGVSELVITGFNAEYCCLFSAIIASDRGYKVTYIEDATASVNGGDTYEMKDLDIVDFIGCILDWSGQVEVLYLEEFEAMNKCTP